MGICKKARKNGDIGYQPNSNTTGMLNFSVVKNQTFFNLANIFMGSIIYPGLPEGIPSWMIERNLLIHGNCSVCYDSLTDSWYCGYVAMTGGLDGYSLPEKWDTILMNGTHITGCTKETAVLFFNNYLALPSRQVLDDYATQIANINLTRDIHIYKHRNPVAFGATPDTRLSIKNIVKSMNDYNYVAIVNQNALQSGELNAQQLMPANNYLANEMVQTEAYIWNQALNYIGICNTQVVKKERMIRDEVNSMFAGALANRQARLDPRVQACEQLRRLGLDIDAQFIEFDDFANWTGEEGTSVE